MLAQIFRRLFSRPASSPKTGAANAQTESARVDIDPIIRMMEDGKRAEAITQLEEILQHDPDHVAAINQLACAYGDVGRVREAAEMFVKAYTLDERLVGSIINHAALLMENRDNTAALGIIHLAKFADPDAKAISQAYSTYLFSEGRTPEAMQYKLQAWLANFDMVRGANGYLFYCTYDHAMSELDLAKEHYFWSATRLQHPISEASATPSLDVLPPPLFASEAQNQAGPNRKIRIGYLTPDLKGHSVSYFFLPLLKGHDTSRVEVCIFDDTVVKDSVTSQVRQQSTLKYIDTSNMSDAEIAETIRSQQLDVLIELSGHTSHNRMGMLDSSLATLLINGLGYPPTTGLTSIRYKFSDPWIHHQADSDFYAEHSLVLNHSFWCFEPNFEVPSSTDVPSARNGYITFGCQGNIAKISDLMLTCWRDIMQQCPGSKLLIRAINFKDSGVLNRFATKLTGFGFRLEDLMLLPPANAGDFFLSYNEVDIVLDTFPFNGGTTTAFALYMGTPVVSLAGQALPSRMGHSMLNTLGLGDLSTTTAEEYVRAAVKLAHSPQRLAEIKAVIRERFVQSALGNPKLFASDLESSLLQALCNPAKPKNLSDLPALDAQEIIRRGYLALMHDNAEAAHRIATYCLTHYPHFGPAHVLFAMQYSAHGELEHAFQYLSTALEDAALQQPEAVIISLLKLGMVCERSLPVLEQLVARAHNNTWRDEIDFLQLQLLSKSIHLCGSTDTHAPQNPSPADFASAAQHVNSIEKRQLVVLTVSDFDAYVTRVTSLMESHWENFPSIQITHVTARFEDRLATLHRIRKDPALQNAAVLLVCGNAVPLHPQSASHLMQMLEKVDVLSYHGSRQFDRINWEYSRFFERFGVFITPSEEFSGHFEMCFSGPVIQPFQVGLQVLSGKLLAFPLRLLDEISMDDELLLAGQTMEEVWTHELFRQGKTLASSARLGVLLLEENPPRADHITTCRNSVAERFGWQAFPSPPDDRIIATVPAKSVDAAIRAIDHLVAN